MCGRRDGAAKWGRASGFSGLLRGATMINIDERHSEEVRFYYWIGRAECARRAAKLADDENACSGYRQLAAVYEETAARIRRSDHIPCGSDNITPMP